MPDVDDRGFFSRITKYSKSENRLTEVFAALLEQVDGHEDTGGSERTQRPKHRPDELVPGPSLLSRLSAPDAIGRLATCGEYPGDTEGKEGQDGPLDDKRVAERQSIESRHTRQDWLMVSNRIPPDTTRTSMWTNVVVQPFESRFISAFCRMIFSMYGP